MQTNCNELKDANIAKIAVQFENYPAQLIEFDQRQPLDENIRNLCNFPDWHCDTQSDIYALQFFEPNFKNYVTEENRINIKNGTILLLTYSAKKFAGNIILALEIGLPGDKSESLKTLKSLAKDIVFATEFINQKGLNLLIELIHSDKFTCEPLKYVLLSFSELMGHGIILWKTLEALIIGRMIYFLTHEPTIIDCVLDILDNIVQNSANPESIEIRLDMLLEILERSACDEVIKQKTFTLINSLFRAAKEARKVKMARAFRTKKYRDVINSSVVKMESMSNELNYQLYVFQTLVLSLFVNRMTPSITENSDCANKIKLLNIIAFQDDRASKADYIKHVKNRYSLGFSSDYDIELLSMTTSPGLLPLDCLEYFAQNYSSIYKAIVIELNSASIVYGFPLGEMAIQLVKLLCDLFKIGQLPSEQNGIYYPIFFSHEHPFYELFCICIKVLHQNWKDMKASSYDFKQVMSIAKEQIVRTLQGRPLNLNDFKRKIKTYPYSTIIMFLELERKANAEYESSVSAIVELKKKLTPQANDIIKKKRLGYLVNGSLFNKYSKSGQRLKNKCWYARLSANLTVLLYGDCDENAIPTVEELPQQIDIVHITQLLVGMECCNLSKRRCQMPFNFLFSIVYLDQWQQPSEPLEFIASDELTQNYWADGLSVLLNLDMRSPRYNADLDTLLSMDIKLKLLDIEGIFIDKNAPAIPPDPEDYDF